MSGAALTCSPLLGSFFPDASAAPTMTTRRDGKTHRIPTICQTVYVKLSVVSIFIMWTYVLEPCSEPWSAGGRTPFGIQP